MNSIIIRPGSLVDLTDAFLREKARGAFKPVAEPLYPAQLREERILAVHFADGGAQGEAGAVEILYRSHRGAQVYYGNYIYGELDYYGLFRALPVLKCLDSRNSSELPYPYGGRPPIPEGWGYLYMGALNHFVVNGEVCDKVSDFVKYFLSHGGETWQVFDAVAWLCGAEMSVRT